MNKFARFARPVSFLSLAGAGSAMAAVPPEVTAAVTGIGVDAGSIATLVLLAIVAVFAIKFIRKGL
ncbi:MAG: hypothetical protein RL260_2808 [Pseudomonadota bacterium]|jgi:hypothetical protein